MLSSFLIFIVLYLLLVYGYFAVAKYFHITDKPNLRSSHAKETVRGGGIIFPVAALVSIFVDSYPGWMLFSSALLIIAAISFADDVISLSSQLRLGVHAIVIIGFLFISSNQLEWYLVILCFIGITGIINAYNFMDGINGITALYSLTAIGSLFWVSEYLHFIVTPTFFLSILASLLAFSFFNLRKNALCFAGDVGSVSMAFIICFLLFTLISTTESIYWLFFLGLYGIDAVFTICCRILRKEQIMKAHRSHFYQFLVNEKNIPHVTVSIIYAVAQLLLNIAVIISYMLSMPQMAIISLFLFILIYITFRFRYEGARRLFVTY